MARYFKNPAQFLSLFQLLCIQYPDLFSLTSVKVMKTKIFEDIIADGRWPHSKSMLRIVLKMYVHTPEYIKARKMGATRYDLQGKEAGRVTEIDKKRASKRRPEE